MIKAVAGSGDNHQRRGLAHAALKGVLLKDYTLSALDKRRRGNLIDLVGNIEVEEKDSRSKHVLGRVHEYFLSRIGDAAGKRRGGFHTPRSRVRLLVEMLEPYSRRIHDPCLGSPGMLLPKLVSGDIRTPDAEELVGASR